MITDLFIFLANVVGYNATFGNIFGEFFKNFIPS